MMTCGVTVYLLAGLALLHSACKCNVQEKNNFFFLIYGHVWVNKQNEYCIQSFQCACIIF